MTRTIVYADGGLTIDGVVVRPPHSMTAGGERPSLLKVADALRSYRRLVAPLEMSIMTTTMRAHLRNATPAERNYRTPEFMRSIEKVDKARALYGQIVSDCMPAGLDQRAFHADVAARRRKALAAFSGQPRSQGAGPAGLRAMVRAAIVDRLRDETAAAFRAGDWARCSWWAGLWSSALNS
jgi:hypothetical protein